MLFEKINNQVFTFSHFHGLNVLWSFGSRKPGVDCMSVCVSVSAEPFGETTVPISTKLTQIGSL